MGRLDGKVAVITGAGGGMGREAALLWRLDGVGRRAALLCGAQLATGTPQGVAVELERYLRLDAAAVAAAAQRWLRPEAMVEVVTRAGRR